MSPLIILLWVCNIFFDTLGQIAFKYSATSPTNRDGWYYWLDLAKNYWIWIGIASYVFEFLLWLAFLTLVPLSLGVLLASFNIITIMLVGRLLFRELLTLYRVIGIALITIGVIFVGLAV
ncbi:hypothetical protein PT276_04560 [Orbaceae bacterium ESL0721]|nr:hypothetical protein [Orbaceae bacterium ESL0721]